MALKVTKVPVWAGDLRDVPGGLADVLDGVSGGGGSVDFLIARRNDKHPGMGKVFLTPVEGARTRDAAARAGLQHAAKMGTLRIEGTDQRGLGARITRAIGDAGVNVRGVSAAVIGGKFVAYIGLDSEEDADLAARALRGVNAGSGAAGRGASRTRRKSTGRSGAAGKRKAPARRAKSRKSSR